MRSDIQNILDLMHKLKEVGSLSLSLCKHADSNVSDAAQKMNYICHDCHDYLEKSRGRGFRDYKNDFSK